MSELLSSIFFGSIYGTGIVTAVVFGVVWLLGKATKKNSHPEVWAVAAGLISLAILPSVPRFQFENDIEEELANSPWVKVVDTAKYGDLTEPLTWFYSPTGFYRFLSPDPLDPSQFWETVVRYQEQPEHRILNVDCDARVFTVSLPDDEGKFRQFPDQLAFEGDDNLDFCGTNWEEQRSALRAKMLRGANQ